MRLRFPRLLRCLFARNNMGAQKFIPRFLLLLLPLLSLLPFEKESKNIKVFLLGQISLAVPQITDGFLGRFFALQPLRSKKREVVKISHRFAPPPPKCWPVRKVFSPWPHPHHLPLPSSSFKRVIKGPQSTSTSPFSLPFLATRGDAPLDRPPRVHHSATIKADARQDDV